MQSEDRTIVTLEKLMATKTNKTKPAIKPMRRPTVKAAAPMKPKNIPPLRLPKDEVDRRKVLGDKITRAQKPWYEDLLEYHRVTAAIDDHVDKAMAKMEPDKEKES